MKLLYEYAMIWYGMVWFNIRRESIIWLDDIPVMQVVCMQQWQDHGETVYPSTTVKIQVAVESYLKTIFTMILTPSVLCCGGCDPLEVSLM